MRFINHCMDCSKEAALKVPNGHKYSIQLSYGEVDTNFLIEFNCSAGHKSLWYYKLEHFDMLYYSALDSFFKGCYSESVMSFSVALERIYELFIKTVLYNKCGDYEIIENYWKTLSKQSERQYGAFCTLYFSEMNDIWKIDEKMVAFRNNVIHKGVITNRDETEIYANYVTDLLSKLVIIIRTKYLKSSNEIAEIRHHRQMEKGQELAVKQSIEFNSSTIISLLKWQFDEPAPITFDIAKGNFELFDFFGAKKKIGLGTMNRK